MFISGVLSMSTHQLASLISARFLSVQVRVPSTRKVILVLVNADGLVGYHGATIPVKVLVAIPPTNDQLGSLSVNHAGI